MSKLRNKNKALILFFFIGPIMASCDMMFSQNEQFDHREKTVYQSSLSEASGNLLYEETFEDESPFTTLHQQFAADYAFSVVNVPVLEGKRAGRFELRSTDRMVANGTRSEVLFPEQDHKERWYSFSVYFPKESFQMDSYREIISQWHQGKAGSPPNSLHVKDDKFILSSVDGNANYTYYEIGEVVKDQWQEFVFHFIHSPDGDGLIEIWLNSQKVLTLEGANLKKGFASPRWKVGIYKWKWNGDNTTDTDLRVLYYDNVRMGNENASYHDMVSDRGPRTL